MNSNDCIKETHAAIVAKVKATCKAAGNNKLALEISGRLADYGAYWATAFGNDGEITDDEEKILVDKFGLIVDGYIPAKEGTLVDKVWNGFSFCFVTVFAGLKSYLTKWFGLEFK